MAGKVHRSWSIKLGGRGFITEAGPPAPPLHNGADSHPELGHNGRHPAFPEHRADQYMNNGTGEDNSRTFLLEFVAVSG